MNRAIAISDRLCRVSLALIAAANVLFLVGFVAAVLLAMDARAAAPDCKGTDLLERMQAEEPALLARIEAEAQAVPNGRGLLWKVEKPGVEASYLFGTMHLTDARVVDLTPQARDAYLSADIVVIETTDVLDEGRMLATMMERPELTMFTDGSTLNSHLDADKAAQLEAALAGRGIPPASVQKMKPWMLAAALSLPACEMARKAAGAQVLDVKLAKEAEADGKRIAGLESATDQLEAMASLPIDFHIEGLIATLKLGGELDDLFETMIVLYEREEVGMVWPLFQAAVPEAADESGYAEFEEVMIRQRNKTMASKAAPFLGEGNSFIAVGALHLPGEEGLVALLRKAGYTVTPAG
ncbi:TraB/GumN family protein [Aquibium sp. LZ166]|uniref:TraB/GumN family protein n=1 Tax=Aquibium pacificus TaxID=3153579 RepID=A0ABV3SGY9_9HYPH